MIGVWLLLCAFVGGVGFVVGHLRSAAAHQVGPWDDSLERMTRAMEERP